MQPEKEAVDPVVLEHPLPAQGEGIQLEDTQLLAEPKELPPQPKAGETLEVVLATLPIVQKGGSKGKEIAEGSTTSSIVPAGSKGHI